MKYLKLIRLGQWTKNFFVFAPLFFSGRLVEMELLYISMAGFLAFCLGAGSIYVLNDLKDAPEDRMHPLKKLRPIASGEVSRQSAYVLFFALAIGALAIALAVGKEMVISLLVYFLINALYTFWLKEISIIDVLLVSAGFVVRVAAGGAITGIEVSFWLYIMTFLLSLFIALAKRRDDVLIYNDTGKQMRSSIQGYNLEYISAALSILSAVLIVSYLDYVTSIEVRERFSGKYAYISVVFVVTGILRYLQITLVEGKSGSPTHILLKDRFLQLTVLLWICFFAMLIYLV